MNEWGRVRVCMPHNHELCMRWEKTKNAKNSIRYPTALMCAKGSPVARKMSLSNVFLYWDIFLAIRLGIVGNQILSMTTNSGRPTSFRLATVTQSRAWFDCARRMTRSWARLPQRNFENSKVPLTLFTSGDSLRHWSSSRLSAFFFFFFFFFF